MHKLVVTLPVDRRYAGTLRIESEDGNVLAGPFPVCARADESAARRHDNPACHSLLPYGDTPLGRYRVAGVFPSGKGTDLPTRQFGPNGVVVLEPLGGDAALADANGRFRLFIQGGALGPGRRLRPTNGALRLADEHQKRLVRALRKASGGQCECRPMFQPIVVQPVAQGVAYEEEDPPRLGIATTHAASNAAGSTFGIRRLRRRFDPPSFRLLANDGSGSGGGGGGGGGDGYSGDDGEKKTFSDYLNDAVTSAGSAVQAALDQAPDKLLSIANDGIVNAFNAQLQKQGQPALDPQSSSALRDDINATLAMACNTIGIHLSDTLKTALDKVAPADANVPVSHKSSPPKISTDFVGSLGLGVFSFNTKGQPNVKYTLSDFKQFGSFKTAIAPLTTNLNQLTVKGSVNSADYSAHVSTVLTISNKAGSLQFDNFSIGFSFKF